MSNPVLHLRHQTSLEGLIDLLTPHQRLDPQQRDQATCIFKTVVEAYEPSQPTNGPYKRITLIRLTYEYARSQASRDNFLQFFIQHMQIPIDISLEKLKSDCDYEPQLIAFADILVENFFLPLKAVTRKTPQPTPATLSELQSTRTLAGTTQRLAVLRKECLIRDRHRCVISRRFDDAEAVKRVRRVGQEQAQDDDGKYLKDESGTFGALEVAHIVPHSLTAVQTGTLELDESKKTALAILNMFDDGVVQLIEGSDIDRARNAITLSLDFHHLFGNFEVFFEPQGNEQHRYRIDTTRSGFLRHPILPVDRTLFLTDTRTIDPPSSRLLAIHSAIAHILHLSAAGHYINRILEDLDEPGIKADGSTELGHLAKLRIQGWWNGQIRAY